MLGRKSTKPQTALVSQEISAGPKSNGEPLLTTVGSSAKLEGKLEIADSIQIECEVGVHEGNMVATGKVEIAETGRVTGSIETDSLVISKGGFFNGNVVESKGDDAAKGPRHVHLVEGARAATTLR